jgi:hypothetical protein
MPLTICTLGPDGAPDDELDILTRDHELLQDEAIRMGLVLLLRMHDYYADAVYSPDELTALVDEAEAVCQLGDQRIAPWLMDLKALALRAMRKNVGLEVICD